MSDHEDGSSDLFDNEEISNNEEIQVPEEANSDAENQVGAHLVS